MRAIAVSGADSGQVASDGQFHIPGVYGRVIFRTTPLQHRTHPSGDYIGLAVKGVQPGEACDPELRKRIEQFGKRFSLEEGETLQLEMPYVE